MIGAACGLQSGSKVRAEEMVCRNQVRGPAEPLIDEVLEAAADGFANRQGPCEHGDRGRDPGHHREIGAPVMDQVAIDEPGEPVLLTGLTGLTGFMSIPQDFFVGFSARALFIV